MKIALIAALPILLTFSGCSEEAVEQSTQEPLPEAELPEEPALTETMPDGVVQDSDGNAVLDESLPDAPALDSDTDDLSATIDEDAEDTGAGDADNGSAEDADTDGSEN